MLDTEKTAELTNFNGTKYYTVLFYIQSLKKKPFTLFGNCRKQAVGSTSCGDHSWLRIGNGN